jgi:hypothetical protein
LGGGFTKEILCLGTMLVGGKKNKENDSDE